MPEPPSPTVGAGHPMGVSGADSPVVVAATVIGADEQSDIDVDVDRWCRLAEDVLLAEGASGELTLTFVDRNEIAALNAEHLRKEGATDVVSFPLDAVDAAAEATDADVVPRLLGDVVVCPAVAAEQAGEHAGTLVDELALLVVHGVLHVLGHDHAEPQETAVMRAAEVAHLEAFHWHGPKPAAFRQEQGS